MADLLVKKENKVKSLPLELRHVKIDFEKNDEELQLVKGKLFDINQRLIRITKEKDAPHIHYMSRMPDTKLQPIISKVRANVGVTSSGATSQQGGEGVS